MKQSCCVRIRRDDRVIPSPRSVDVGGTVGARVIVTGEEVVGDFVVVGCTGEDVPPVTAPGGDVGDDGGEGGVEEDEVMRNATMTTARRRIRVIMTDGEIDLVFLIFGPSTRFYSLKAPQATVTSLPAPPFLVI